MTTLSGVTGLPGQLVRRVVACGLFALGVIAVTGCVSVAVDQGPYPFYYRNPGTVLLKNSIRPRWPATYYWFVVASSCGPRDVSVHEVRILYPLLPTNGRTRWLISRSSSRIFFVRLRLASLKSNRRVTRITAVARAMRGSPQPYYVVSLSPLVVGIPLAGEFPKSIPIRQLQLDWARPCLVPARYADSLQFRKILVLRTWPGRDIIQSLERHYFGGRHLKFRKFIETHTTVIHLPKPTSAINLMKAQPWKTMGLKFHYP